MLREKKSLSELAYDADRWVRLVGCAALRELLSLMRVRSRQNVRWDCCRIGGSMVGILNPGHLRAGPQNEWRWKASAALVVGGPSKPEDGLKPGRSKVDCGHPYVHMGRYLDGSTFFPMHRTPRIPAYRTIGLGGDSRPRPKDRAGRKSLL